jgi:hypothetical protein
MIRTTPIEIDPHEKVTHFFATLPKERRRGVEESWVPAVFIRGRIYHFLSDNEWFDTETGDIIRFICQGIFI